MKPEIKITSSKGDSFFVKDVIRVEGDDDFIHIDSVGPSTQVFDKVARDRGITLLLWSDNGVRANPSGD